MAQRWNTCLACTGPGLHSSLSPTKAHSIPEGGRPLHIHLPKVAGVTSHLSSEARQKRGHSQLLVFSAVGRLSGYHQMPNGCPCQNPLWLLSQGTPLTQAAMGHWLAKDEPLHLDGRRRTLVFWVSQISGGRAEGACAKCKCERQSIQLGIAVHCDDRGWDKSDFNLTEPRASHTEHGGRWPRNGAIDNPLFPPPCPRLLPSPLSPRQSCFCFWRLKPLKVYILLALVAHTFYEFKGSLIYLVSSRPVRVMS